MTDIAAPSTATSSSSNSTIYKILGVIGILILIFLGYRLLTGGGQTQAATISGTVNFNGLKPSDDPNAALSLKLLEKSPDQADFTDTGVSIPVADGGTWVWSGAQAGTTYTLRADGFYGDTKIKSSNLLITTAPASDQVLTFNVSLSDLPEDLRPTPSAETVSGVLVINGFIPSGATVTIFGRQAGSDNDFQAAIEDIRAQNGATWSYDDAEAGQTYDYQAEMYAADGTFIGQSSYLTVTAPAANEVVTINSTARAPQESATISGTIRLQGPVAQNSTILVLQRESGATDYTPIDRYPAANNTEWTWDGAVSGTSYDITAALQVNEQNTATGNVVTVAAPAQSVTLTIDTGVNLTPPTQTVSVTCGDPDATNHFNAQIGLPQIEGAKLYYLEVGTSAGANNTFANTVQPNRDATVFLTANSPHFARYSYSTCTDCAITDTGNWAGWSPTLGFTCPATAQP